MDKGDIKTMKNKANMYTATTPRYVFRLPFNANQFDKIEVTCERSGTQIVKLYQNETLPDGMEFKDNLVIVQLTQEETLMFKNKESAIIQLRALIDDYVCASAKYLIPISDSLSEEIL